MCHDSIFVELDRITFDQKSYEVPPSAKHRRERSVLLQVVLLYL
jgi:hypothetical protein